ncbi:MAG: DUF4116 domain-containing protein [Clostridia bacterium]|nr:DUF4116 domain-containing protein [Clostridia bacterium]
MPRGAKAKDEIVYQDFATKKEALKYVTTTMYALKSMAEKWRDDKDVVMRAVKKFGGSLEFASARLQADPEIVIEALKTDPRALMFASQELRDNLDVRNYAYSKMGAFIVDPVAWRVFQNLDAKMMRETIAKGEIFINGRNYNLQEMCDSLRKAKAEGTLDAALDKYGFERGALAGVDFSKLEKFIKKNGDVAYSEEKTERHPTYQRFSKYYAGKMTANEVIALENELIAQTITNADKAIDFLSRPGRGKCFVYFNASLKSNKKVVLKAIEVFEDAFQYADYSLKADKEVVLKAIEKNPYALIYAAPVFRDDPAIRKMAYDKVGVFVVEPLLRKMVADLEKQQEQSRIKRPKKPFATRAEHEKFIAEVILKVASAKSRVRPTYERVTEDMMIRIENALCNPSTANELKLEKVLEDKEAKEREKKARAEKSRINRAENDALIQKLIAGDDEKQEEQSEEQDNSAEENDSSDEDSI